MKVVLSLGGSLLVEKLDANNIIKYADLIKEFSKKNKIGVVVGGGRTAREYLSVAEKLNASKTFCDYIGIDITRINARLLMAALQGNCNELIPKDLEEALAYFDRHPVVVMGGIMPGVSTDAIAALLAEELKTDRLVNASNVAGIYDSDPKKNPKAKKFNKMTHDQLVLLCAEHDKRRPKEKFIFDLFAAKILARSNIEAHFVLGDVSIMKKAFLGEKHSGTIVRD